MSDFSETSNDEPRKALNPVEQIFGLFASIDPIDFAEKAVDISKRSTEALLGILENFASTIDNLNKTTTRVNSLLDEMEEPLRRILPQMGTAMNAMASFGDIAGQLSDLTKRLGPLTSLVENAGGLFGLRGTKPAGSTGASSQTE